MLGLGSNYWGEVLEVLKDIIPVYDRVNSCISLGKDASHRRRAIHGRIAPGSRVLDAGSGFGNMSKTASEMCDICITLYDPLVPMLKNTAGSLQMRQTCPAVSLSTSRSGTGSLTQ